jgi:hypothetical protein
MAKMSSEGKTIPLKDIIDGLELLVLTSRDISNVEVNGGYVCDLLSDVMANARPKDLWITMQTHQNVLAVAQIKELAGIVLVNGRRPDDETVRKADEQAVTILAADESAFELSGRLYHMLDAP